MSLQDRRQLREKYRKLEKQTKGACVDDLLRGTIPCRGAGSTPRQREEIPGFTFGRTFLYNVLISKLHHINESNIFHLLPGP
eukprot:9130780-Pyramimonas_sp.AAC.1